MVMRSSSASESAILAISLGCTVSGPTPSQRREPSTMIPTPGMSTTLDVYQITVTNRIVGSGQIIGLNGGTSISGPVTAAIVASGAPIDPAVLAERLILCIFGYGTNIGLRAIAAGEHSHTEEDLRYQLQRHRTLPRFPVRAGRRRVRHWEAPGR